MEQRQEEAKRFLNAVFGNKPDELFVLIWTLPSKQSRWFRDLHGAAELARHEGKSEVYVGVGLSPRDFGSRQRCKANEVACVPGVIADIDVAGPAHRKPDLPPTLDDAFALVNDFPLRPSALVDSGHGLQCWFLFNEPWVLASKQERTRAAALFERWNDTLIERGRHRGWAVDATKSLAQVLRLPGTFNNKLKQRKPVRLVDLDEGRRYHVSDIEPFLVHEKRSTTAVRKMDKRQLADEIVKELTLRADAQPPHDKFNVLLANRPEAKRLWEGQRSRGADKSDSADDQAMANFCVEFNWSNQEIADVLIAFRKKHHRDLKLRHLYYGLTIGEARLWALERSEKQEVNDVLRSVVEDGQDVGPKKLIRLVSEKLGVELQAIRKYEGKNVRYRFILKDDRHAVIGDGKAIISQQTFRAHMFQLADVYIKPMSGEHWNALMGAVARYCALEEAKVHLGPEASEAGNLREWIDQYLTTYRPELVEETGKPEDETIVRDLPFIVVTHRAAARGDIYLRSDALRQYLTRYMDVRVLPREMPQFLRDLGFETKKQNTSAGRSSRTYWRLAEQNVAAFVSTKEDNR